MRPIIILIILIIVIATTASFITYALTGAFSSNPVKEAQQQATAAVILARMTPSPLPTSPNTTPTMSFMEFSYTQVAIQEAKSAAQQSTQEANRVIQQANEQSFALTQQANEMALEQQKLAVEAASIRATADEKKRLATSEAAQSTAAAYANMQTAQANDLITAQAHATEFIQTEQANSTQAAQTSVAFGLTAAVAPTHDQWTQEAAYVAMTVEAAEGRQAVLAVQKQSAKNLLDAYLPWLLIIAVAWVAGKGFGEWVKTRTHPRDEHGRSQVIQRKLKDGSVIFMKPEQFETGIVKVTDQGEVTRYAPMDPAEQSNINSGNIVSEIVGHLPTQYARTGKSMLENFAKGMRKGSDVSFHEGPALRPVIEEADQQYLQEES